jgi:hypothetical protein
MNRLSRSIGFALTFVTVFGFQVSCVDHDFPSYTCPEEEVSFNADVRPIIEAKCAISSCHNGSLGAERDWSNFATFQHNATDGNVKNYVTNRIMPPSFSPNGGLSQEQINTIACWIDADAPNN